LIYVKKISIVALLILISTLIGCQSSKSTLYREELLHLMNSYPSETDCIKQINTNMIITTDYEDEELNYQKSYSSVVEYDLVNQYFYNTEYSGSTRIKELLVFIEDEFIYKFEKSFYRLNETLITEDDLDNQPLTDYISELISEYDNYIYLQTYADYEKLSETHYEATLPLKDLFKYDSDYATNTLGLTSSSAIKSSDLVIIDYEFFDNQIVIKLKTDKYQINTSSSSSLQSYEITTEINYVDSFQRQSIDRTEYFLATSSEAGTSYFIHNYANNFDFIFPNGLNNYISYYFDEGYYYLPIFNYNNSNLDLLDVYDTNLNKINDCNGHFNIEEAGIYYLYFPPKNYEVNLNINWLRSLATGIIVVENPSTLINELSDELDASQEKRYLILESATSSGYIDLSVETDSGLWINNGLFFNEDIVRIYVELGCNILIQVKTDFDNQFDLSWEFKSE